MFKPMLSGECTDITKLRYPVLVSPKLDGIRALVIAGVLVSRNLKPIPNVELQMRYGRAEYEGLDGELIAGPPTALDCFRVTTSVVMSREKPAANVDFYVFDCLDRGTFAQRVDAAATRPGRAYAVRQRVAHTPGELEATEERFLAAGYEGVMIRDPKGPYKQGRSTEKEGYLLKLKRFADAEAAVLQSEEQMENTNAATKDALGHTKRSTHKAGMVGKGTLGALVVEGLNGPYKGVRFNIGTGFDDATRAALWAEPSLRGRIVKYKYFPSGSKDAPRFPTFIGFRDPQDM